MRKTRWESDIWGYKPAISIETKRIGSSTRLTWHCNAVYLVSALNWHCTRSVGNAVLALAWRFQSVAWFFSSEERLHTCLDGREWIDNSMCSLMRVSWLIILPRQFSGHNCTNLSVLKAATIWDVPGERTTAWLRWPSGKDFQDLTLLRSTMRRLFLFQDWPESLVQVLELMQQKRRVNSNEIKGKETITAQSMLQVVVLPKNKGVNVGTEGKPTWVLV